MATPCRFLNCGGMIGYVEDILYYIARHFIQTGRGHEAFKDQRFWTDMFLAQVPSCACRRLSDDVTHVHSRWHIRR